MQTLRKCTNCGKIFYTLHNPTIKVRKVGLCAACRITLIPGWLAQYKKY